MDEHSHILAYARPTPGRVERWSIVACCVSISGGLAAAGLTLASAVFAGPLAIGVAPACAATVSLTAAAVARHARVRFGLLAAAIQFIGLLGWTAREGWPRPITIDLVAYVTLVGFFFFALPALIAAMTVAITALEPPPGVSRDRR
jgi:hypothetical protein